MDFSQTRIWKGYLVPFPDSGLLNQHLAKGHLVNPAVRRTVFRSGGHSTLIRFGAYRIPVFAGRWGGRTFRHTGTWKAALA